MNMITSRNNELIVRVAKLKDKKHRDNEKVFLFEGIKLTREAISSNIELEHIFMTQKCADSYPDIASMDEAILISDSVCEKISENKAPEGIICTAKYIDRLHKNYTQASEVDKKDACLILSSIQDPGNLGTIARTSAAFGKKTLIISSDSADIYSQKTVRASMGAIFRTKINRTERLEDAVKDMKSNGFTVYATALHKDAVELQNIPQDKENACFILGNEGHGLDQSIIDACTRTVIIPMEPDAESLNVSSAASVILWENYRKGKI